MKTIKTAISIDAKTFSRVNRLSKKLRISRSRFFAQAAEYMVSRDENLELLQKINKASGLSDEEVERMRSEKAYARKKVIDSW